MIDDLRQNVNMEIEILREISNNLNRRARANASEKRLLDNSIESLRSSLKLLNNALPSILEEITVAQQLPNNATKVKGLERIEFKRLDSKIHVTLKVEDRHKFLKEVSISEDLIKRYKHSQDLLSDTKEEVRSARLFYKISNKFFLKYSIRLINNGNFKDLYGRLRKANIEVLLSSYVAGMFFAVFISFLASLFLTLFFTFFGLSAAPPFIGLRETEPLTALITLLWIPIILPSITFLAFYLYPSSEQGTLEKKIEQELPFAVIHMSAIASSGIEPSEIFKIIRSSNEYPTLKQEIRKVLNQINIYGYDLVTALKNVSKSTPSTKFSELLSGLAVTVTSGGDLAIFLEKRAETLLMQYRLDREKFTRTAETFMDMYISIVIAAPMILLVLMVMMEVASLGPSLSGGTIALIVAILNVVFLVALDLKTPTY